MRAYTTLGVEKYVVMGFLSLILAGTFLLWGTNRLADMPLPLVDALFLSTSSVCVTGLATVDIATALPLASQAVMMILIQLGGIGIMAATSSLIILTGQRLHVRDRLLLAGGLGVDSPRGVVRLLHLILVYTFAFELCGVAVFLPQFLSMGLSLPKALFYSFFHAVSAFCNAGFALFSDNLVGFATSVALPATVMILIVAGGIGFPVVMELRDYAARRTRFLSPYTKIVLSTTAILLVVGALLLTLSEWYVSFAALPVWARFWNGLFGSVTARTAGFEMVHYGNWSAEGLTVTICLMFIGASPSSTGGGLKTTTFAILMWTAWSELRQNDEPHIAARRIPNATIRRALALAFVYISTLFFSSIALSALEQLPFSKLLFEAVSALGTVGLSTGITAELSTGSKLVLVLLMYWGRVGILTFSYSVISRDRLTGVHLPETNVPIG